MNTEHNTLLEIFRRLGKAYGYQGWWPLQTRAGSKGYNGEGYRLSPEVGGELSDEELLEVGVGAVLTQNTTWKNARTALIALRTRGLLNLDSLLRIETGELAEVIRSCGYYNQKAQKLVELARMLGRLPQAGDHRVDMRAELLRLWGIGPETADSILLYGFGEPHFVVDAYGKRIFTRAGLVVEGASYREVQDFCHHMLPSDAELFGEYHALLVRHAQQSCRTVPDCSGCPLRSVCAFGRGWEGRPKG